MADVGLSLSCLDPGERSRVDSAVQTKGFSMTEASGFERRVGKGRSYRSLVMAL